MRNFFRYIFFYSRYIQKLSIGMFFFAAAFLSSCSKPGIVGLDVQPKSDLLNVKYTDTLSITTFTVKEDSLRADETSLNLLGSYSDPVFGRSTTSFYTQVRLSKENPDFGTNPVLDSVVIAFAYKGYYGDTNTTQTVRVFKLQESIDKAADYYSNKSFNAYPNIGNLTFNPHPTDSVLVGGINAAPQLRIKLDNSFGKDLLYAGSTNLANNTAFLQVFKGLNISADDINTTNQGAVLYFDLLSAQSKLTVYYNDSLKFDFVTDANAARINHFAHDYAGTPVNAELNGTATDTDWVYVQAMAGVKTKILMPNLNHLTDSGTIAVNKAELVISVDNTNTSYSPNPTIALVRIDSLGKIYYLSDQLEESSYFGGTYDSATNKYKFNIAKYVQEVLNGSITDYGLYLLSSGSAVSANRIIVGSGSNANYKMKLKITYTKL